MLFCQISHSNSDLPNFLVEIKGSHSHTRHNNNAWEISPPYALLHDESNQLGLIRGGWGPGNRGLYRHLDPSKEGGEVDCQRHDIVLV